ncbi:ROK family protein [Kutzneria buriramensis]|uniref:Glucokinase n=1 Tax=Kutzneria buriramensis TaxID=1045776 RepID=A0A3E0GW68_9PSEU|nr:ROK family protein [Kutzneria buriramensis]REH31108.1 glucokinase [Kutzneria buriramensis]
MTQRSGGANVAAVDVGGTQIKAALVDEDLTVTAERRCSTPVAGPDRAREVADAAARLVAELADATGRRVDAVGLVVPGIVDAERGVVVRSGSMGWREEPLRDLVAERTGLPTAFGHDVRTAGLAEYRLGAAAGSRSAMFLALGTGLAAALVLDGRLFEGGGFAGELGHVDVGVPEPCRCDMSGCFEAVSSAAAIARRYTARTGRPVDGAAEVAALLETDPDAAAVWADAVHGIAVALAWSVSLLAVDTVVIGGGLSLAGPKLLEPVEKELAGLLTFQRSPTLVAAALGDRAGCLGAALLALDALAG